jgi:hypothetical protein
MRLRLVIARSVWFSEWTRRGPEPFVGVHKARTAGRTNTVGLPKIFGPPTRVRFGQSSECVADLCGAVIPGDRIGGIATIMPADASASLAVGS